MLGVFPRSAAALHELHFGNGDRGSAKYSVDGRAPRPLECRRFDAAPGRNRRSIDVVGYEQLAGVAPDIVHGALHSIVALLGSVAELDHPVSAVADVVLHFLHGFAGDPRKLGVRGLPQGVELEIREDTEQELPRYREREVAPWQLDEERIAIVHGFPEIRESILIPIVYFGLSSKREEKVRLSDQVEGDVGERDV